MSVTGGHVYSWTVILSIFISVVVFCYANSPKANLDKYGFKMSITGYYIYRLLSSRVKSPLRNCNDENKQKIDGARRKPTYYRDISVQTDEESYAPPPLKPETLQSELNQNKPPQNSPSNGQSPNDDQSSSNSSRHDSTKTNGNVAGGQGSANRYTTFDDSVLKTDLRNPALKKEGKDEESTLPGNITLNQEPNRISTQAPSPVLSSLSNSDQDESETVESLKSESEAKLNELHPPGEHVEKPKDGLSNSEENSDGFEIVN